MKNLYIFVKLSKKEIRDKVAKMYKLNSYFFSLFLALFLCTGAAQAGQFMICNLYTTSKLTVPATMVGWLIYREAVGSWTKIQTFPNNKDNLINYWDAAARAPEIVTLVPNKITPLSGDYFNKITFYSNDKDKKLSATLQLNKGEAWKSEVWKYEASGSYNGKPLSSKVDCTNVEYFDDPLIKNQIKLYSTKLYRISQFAGYDVVGDLPDKDSNSEEIKKPTPAEEEQERSKSYDTKEYGACVAYLHRNGRSNSVSDEKWPLSLEWTYISKPFEIFGGQKLGSTKFNGVLNTQMDMNNPKLFKVSNNRVVKIVGNVNIDGYDRQLTMTKTPILKNINGIHLSSVEWDISFENSADITVVPNTLTCVTSKEKAFNVTLDPLKISASNGENGIVAPSPTTVDPKVNKPGAKPNRPDSDRKEPQKEDGICKGCNIS